MPSQLHIFDFDKTLFRSPEKPSWWTEGWWGRPESLQPPCVPEKPGSAWWVGPTVAAARKAISDPDVYAAAITGRLHQHFRHRVHALLKQAGLRFDGVYLSPGGNTEGSKLQIFGALLTQMPDITHVEIWEDRVEHIGKFKSFFESKGLTVKTHAVRIQPQEVACAGPNKTAEVVVARYLQARPTKNFEFLKGLFEDLKEVWHKLPRRSPWSKKQETTPADDVNAKAFAKVAKILLDNLHITSDSPALARGLKKYEGKIRLFRKMLKAWSETKGWDELEAVMNSQGTQSKSAWNKLIEYQERILGLLAHVDAEVDTTIHIGPYTVILITAHQTDWNNERVEKLKHVLKKVDQHLSRIGMGSMSGGTLYAYPTKLLPASAMTSHNALASYAPARDTMQVAAEGEPGKLIDTMLHELGHRAYFKLVEGRGRSAWSDFFQGGLGVPDIDHIVKTWERAIANLAGEENQWRGRFLGYYVPTLQKTDKEDAMWLNMLSHQLGIKEKFNPYSGAPKKNVVPGLDQLIAKRNEAKVFLYPVTAYSGTSAEELFAETFQAFTTKGGAHVHPLVKHAFKMTIPSFKMASSAVAPEPTHRSQP